jgi:hypothetical protein
MTYKIIANSSIQYVTPLAIVDFTLYSEIKLKLVKIKTTLGSCSYIFIIHIPLKILIIPLLRNLDLTHQWYEN